MNMDLDLKNKTIVVTGGASGIGAAIVNGLVQEGAIPVVIDKSRVGLQSLAQAHSSLFKRKMIETYLCDLSDPLDTQRVLSELNLDHTDIYGLVNNAGANDGIGLNSDVASFMSSLHKNLVHYFQMTQGLVARIKQAQGSIINISSKVAVTGQGGTSGYAAAKGAINALTREWAVDLAPFNVDVNCVIPAEVNTPQYASWLQTQEGERRLPAILKKINLGTRLTTPEEIADYVLFLLSQKSSHTTGQLLFVDGGYTHLDDSKN